MQFNNEDESTKYYVFMLRRILDHNNLLKSNLNI